MGFRFRQALRIVPGLRLNLSKSGVSASLGVRGATLNLGKRGVRGTVGLPGSGVSYSKMLLRSGNSTASPLECTTDPQALAQQHKGGLVSSQASDEAAEDALADLYLLTAHLVVGNGKASASWLQRQLQIGYADAADLIEQLEIDGIVSHPDKVGMRKVLVDIQSLPELPGNGSND